MSLTEVVLRLLDSLRTSTTVMAIVRTRPITIETISSTSEKPPMCRRAGVPRVHQLTTLTCVT